MSNAARKARKAAGEPSPIKPPKTPTPYLERTIPAKKVRSKADELLQASSAKLKMKVK